MTPSSGECAGAALLFLCHEMIAVGIYGCLRAVTDIKL